MSNVFHGTVYATDEVIAELEQLGIRAAVRQIVPRAIPRCTRGACSQRGNATVWEIRACIGFDEFGESLPAEWRAGPHRELVCKGQLIRYDSGPAGGPEEFVLDSFRAS